MFRLLTAFVASVGVQLILALPVEEIVTGTVRQPALNAAEFSYQVLISQLEEGPKCGGVLVAEGFIVTSATCILEFGGIKKFLEEAVLYGGGTSLLFDLGDLSDAIIHPKYIVSPNTYDVAIIKFVPQEKRPRLTPVVLNGTRSNQSPCILTSWWEKAESWPERLMWQFVSVVPCSPPEPNLLCFSDDTTTLSKSDHGSPIVCGGMLTGLIPRNAGKRAINLTSDYDWIIETMAEMARSVDTPEEGADDETKLYLNKILQRLDTMSLEKDSENVEDHLTKWNNQIVVPLSYVLFAMVIFFFVLLFFIILFTVVLVYYSRK